MARLCIVGDVHGYRDRLCQLLQTAGLVDERARWCGGAASLAVLGDLVDRGPDGIGVIELLQRLEVEAADSGGKVLTLLGNHDVLFLAASRFGEPFFERWRASGGQQEDMERLTPDHVAWLRTRPAMALEQQHLLVHADALLYATFGASVPHVNERIAALLAGDELEHWFDLLDQFFEHGAFHDPRQVERQFETFGGERLVHGHTPIMKQTGQPPSTVTHALVYAGGRCVNVDHGLYRGGPGFVYEAVASGG